MVVIAVCNREIRDTVGDMLAYQRDAPISIRLMSPWIHDTKLSDGKMLSEKINRLIKFKSANITILVNPSRMQKEDEIEFLKKLEDMGAKIHYKRGLHAKAILVDSKRDKCLLVTTANLTPTGLGENKEIGIYLLNEFGDIFKKIDEYITDILGKIPSTNVEEG